MKKALIFGISLSMIGSMVLCSCDKAQTAESETETTTISIVSEETTTEETTTETTEETTEETTTETTEETTSAAESEEPKYTLPAEVEENMSEADKAIIMTNLEQAGPDQFETQELKDYVEENIYNANLIFIKLDPAPEYGVIEGVVTTVPMSDKTNLHYVIKFDSKENAMNYFDADEAAASSGIHIVFEEQEDGSVTMNIDEKSFELDATITSDGLLTYSYKSKEE